MEWPVSRRVIPWGAPENIYRKKILVAMSFFTFSDHYLLMWDLSSVSFIMIVTYTDDGENVMWSTCLPSSLSKSWSKDLNLLNLSKSETNSNFCCWLYLILFIVKSIHHLSLSHLLKSKMGKLYQKYNWYLKGDSIRKK